METVHKIKITELWVVCPYCGCYIGDWLDSPKGETVKCDNCGKDFWVANDADFEMEL